MGGDDLGDDFLLEELKDDNPVENFIEPPSEEPLSGKKRRLDATENDTDADVVKDDNKRIHKDKLLVQAGKRIDEQSIQEQCQFLKTLLNHYRLLSDNPSSKIVVPQERFLAQSRANNLLERIKESISMKRLKQKHISSPSVLVVTISARRCVSVLKELSGLRTRAAKLFPKNGTVESQKMLLSEHAFGLAVGTPHRLTQLGLNLGKTQLVVIDCHVTHKDYTVATLPDTAADLAEFLDQCVLPQLQRRKDMRLAFF